MENKPDNKLTFDYFSQIEELFNKRRGKFLFLSAGDWALIERWHTKEVPLEIILDVINKDFDRLDKAEFPRKIHSLSFFSSAVDDAHFYYLKSLQKKSG